MNEFIGTLYTPEVREYVRSRDWPKELIFDVYEDEFQLNFVFYRDNWITFDTQTHLRIAATIKEVMEKLRSDGIPCYMGAMRGRYEHELE